MSPSSYRAPGERRIEQADGGGIASEGFVGEGVDLEQGGRHGALPERGGSLPAARRFSRDLRRIRDPLSLAIRRLAR